MQGADALAAQAFEDLPIYVRQLRQRRLSAGLRPINSSSHFRQRFKADHCHDGAHDATCLLFLVTKPREEIACMCA